jgi:antitoxin component YwqK of YwqJK toxin-antitoxin module
VKIYFLNDTTGKPLDFGNLENGTGHVNKYDFKGTLQYSGNYTDGNKEGWWYYYHFSGEVLDSTFYEGGIDVSSADTSWVDIAFGSPGKGKNNFYN